jgi:hypothetical protein
MHDEQRISVELTAIEWAALLRLLERMWFPVDDKRLLDGAYFAIEGRLKGKP